MLHILSNGQHFEDEDMPKKKYPCKFKHFVGYPLYSHDYKNHDEIVGKEGAFNKVMETFLNWDPSILLRS